MTAAVTQRDGLLRRAAYRVLLAAVRGRRERGGPWGEAVLGEFAMTRGGWEAVRWAAGGLRTVWQERREKARHLPRYDRLGRRILALAVLAAVLAIPLRMFVISAQYVVSDGMEPTLHLTDRFLVDKLSWRVSGLDRGDIITFRAPNDPGTTPDVSTHVKRVVGLPGDTISCHDRQILRDGIVLDEPFLPPDGVDGAAQWDECATVTVPPDSVYVLGDHRLVSRDSRQTGPVAMDAVTGRLLTRIWPLRD